MVRVLRRRLARNYAAHPEMELPPPYESIQLDVERQLYKYLHVRPEEILQVIIVGAHEADEVDRMRLAYPRASFLCFEPNPEAYKRIVQRFASCSCVAASNKALGSSPGKARFYELTAPGNGSLLEPRPEDWATFSQTNDKNVMSFEVAVGTLDQEAASLKEVDLLWVDVQGGEGNVFKGGGATLRRTKAVFLEVAMVRSPYEGAALFPEINEQLQSYGFTCVGLGLDGWNATGNALFVRQLESLICRKVEQP
jgi:FkbM family methyltransferase